MSKMARLVLALLVSAGLVYGLSWTGARFLDGSIDDALPLVITGIVIYLLAKEFMRGER